MIWRFFFFFVIFIIEESIIAAKGLIETPVGTTFFPNSSQNLSFLREAKVKRAFEYSRCRLSETKNVGKLRRLR